MIWFMMALNTARVEALGVGDIQPALHLPAVLWQDAKAVAQNRVLGVGGILQSLVQNGADDEEFARRLGFASKSEVLGVPGQPPEIIPPFAVIRVDLNRLQSFHPGSDPLMLLLGDGNWFQTFGPNPIYSPIRLLFPIVVNSSVKSSMLLRFSLNSLEWDVQQLGTPELITHLTGCGTGQTAPNSRCDGKKYFAVWIPSLNRIFLGRIDLPSGTFKITPVFKEPNYPTIQVGVEIDAKVIFPLMKLEAIGILPTTPPR
jgi:hypothetical protein